MHREDLAIHFRPGERALRRGQLGTDQHGKHAPDAEKHGSGNDEALAKIGMAYAAEHAAPAGFALPDARQFAVELDCLHRAASTA